MTHEGYIMKIFTLNKLAIACVAVTTLIFGGIADAHANRAGGDKRETPSEKRTGSSKNERHGDGGRAIQSADRRIADLQAQIKPGMDRRERIKIENRINNIRKDAQKKAKGETHSTKGKGRR